MIIDHWVPLGVWPGTRASGMGKRQNPGLCTGKWKKQIETESEKNFGTQPSLLCCAGSIPLFALCNLQVISGGHLQVSTTITEPTLKTAITLPMSQDMCFDVVRPSYSPFVSPKRLLAAGCTSVTNAGPDDCPTSEAFGRHQRKTWFHLVDAGWVGRCHGASQLCLF